MAFLASFLEVNNSSIKTFSSSMHVSCRSRDPLGERGKSWTMCKRFLWLVLVNASNDGNISIYKINHKNRVKKSFQKNLVLLPNLMPVPSFLATMLSFSNASCNAHCRIGALRDTLCDALHDSQKKYRWQHSLFEFVLEGSIAWFYTIGFKYTFLSCPNAT